MEVGPEDRPLCRGGSSRHQASDQAGQHVTTPAGGKTGVPGWVQIDLALRGSDRGRPPFEEEYDPVLAGEGANDLDPIPVELLCRSIEQA